MLATRNGLVKKSRLTDFDSNRTGGIIAINLRDDDELVGAVLCSAERRPAAGLRQGQSIRFTATDEALRPMGRATSGVHRDAVQRRRRAARAEVVREGMFVLVATAGGYAKRTPIEEYPVQGRGGKGVLTAPVRPQAWHAGRGAHRRLDDELYAITSSGGVIRTTASEVRKAGRQTKGVRLMNLGDGATLLAVARNAEDDADDAELLTAPGELHP